MPHPHRTRPPRRTADGGAPRTPRGPRLEQTPPSPRRAQANLQPPTRRRGIDVVADALFAALEAGAAEDAYASPFPHGFHSWPAGLHPAIARLVMDGLLPHAGPGPVVDPFAGGGTVGLEALLHRRAFLGTDLNPLSRLVGGERCRPRTRVQAGVVVEVALAVTEASKERVRGKVPARAPVPPEVARQYLPHTLMELAGLLEEIDAVGTNVGKDLPKDELTAIRRSLAVCFSAILTKVSQRRGDTDDGRAPARADGAPGPAGKRVGRFIPSEQFFARVEDLADRQVALLEALGDDVDLARQVAFHTDDARALPRLLGRERAQLILTSPPYGGTYNYIDHHAHRLAFLGLDGAAFERGELFPRRLQHDGRAFDDGTRALLATLKGALHADGIAVVVVGDADLAGERVDAADHLDALAGPAGLSVVAVASAPRADFLKRHPREQPRGPRHEHLVALTHRG